MIKSMTAFARAEKTVDKFMVSAEIRSYNSRQLDIVLRIPPGYHSLEEKIKGLIASMITRGRIELMLKIRNESDAASDFEIDIPLAKAYHKSLSALKDLFDISDEISLAQMMGASGIIRPCVVDADVDACWEMVGECITDALSDLGSMRKREGDNLAGDFTERLDYVERSVAQIEQAVVDLASHYQERLKERISALTNGIVEIDPGRIAQEAAFLADKGDISEEIVRAGSHINQFRVIMDSTEPAGRKLNFLLQEFNREFNTMGSKAASDQVSHMIVDLKSELEKLREQVQNVE